MKIRESRFLVEINGLLIGLNAEQLEEYIESLENEKTIEQKTEKPMQNTSGVSGR